MKRKTWPFDAFVQALYADAQGNVLPELTDRQSQPSAAEAPYRLALKITFLSGLLDKDQPQHTAYFVGANGLSWCCASPDGWTYKPAPFNNQAPPNPRSQTQDCAFIYGWGDCLGAEWNARLLPVFFEHFPQHERPAYCFGFNRSGSPKHPLYLRKDAPLTDYKQGS